MTARTTGHGVDTVAPPRPDPTHAPPTVRLLTPSDVPTAARVLARAFAEEPAKQGLLGAAARPAAFADAAARARFAEAVARARLLSAARYAAVHVAEVDGRVAGVAIWYPPGSTPGAPPAPTLAAALVAPGTRVLSLFGSVLGGLWRDRRALLRLIAGRTAAAATAGRGPSWYLAVLGTDPDQRGRGVARRLLERTLERCDAEGLPAWLETTEEATTGLYERFGFETIRAVPGGAVLPGIWVMRRAPQPR